MSSPSVDEFFSRFPISGLAVTRILEEFLGADEICCVHDIETLSSAKSLELGRLWHEISSGLVLSMKFAEFARIIAVADQVVALSLSRMADQSRRLVIEDGHCAEFSL